MVLAAFSLTTSLLSTSLVAQELKMDKEKSKISFLGKKSDGEHKGGFKKFKIDAKPDFENPTNSWLQIEIDTESLWADDPKLEEHLKNEDFFNVKKFPKAVFESTKIEADQESAKITGKMKLLGETKELVVPAKIKLTEEGIDVKAEFKLDRTKWGMNYGQGKINDEVAVTAELYFTR